MKYVMVWTARNGSSGAENEASVRRALELFSKWQPEPGTTIREFLGRADSEGGFAVVETDDITQVLNATARFAPYVQYQVYPVVEVDQWVTSAQEAIGYRNGIG